MEKKYLSLPIRISSYMLVIFFLYPVVGILTGIIDTSNSSEKINFVIGFIVLEIILLFLMLGLHISYFFSSESIGYKLPFLKEKKFVVKDLLGWATISGSIIFYFESGKLTIPLSGKKLKKEISCFIENNYETIKKKNIDKIKTDGVEYVVGANKKLTINDKCIILKTAKQTKSYSIKEILDMKLFSNGSNFFLKLIFNDSKVIKINATKINGGIGLIDFLNSKKSC